MMVFRQSHWIAAKVEDQLVMMNIEKDSYIGLSDTGARIWDLIEEPKTIEEIAERLQAEYDVSASVCREEVKAFLDELLRHGAVTLHE